MSSNSDSTRNIWEAEREGCGDDKGVAKQDELSSSSPSAFSWSSSLQRVGMGVEGEQETQSKNPPNNVPPLHLHRLGICFH